MKAFVTIVLAFASLAANSQTLTFNQISHIQTALNHLTVIELGEPVLKVEIADRVAFDVQRYDDEVSITPLKSEVCTNLFIWTATREISYEIDPAGDVAKMNVLIRNVPAPQQRPASAQAGAPTPSDEQIRTLTSLVLTKALIESKDITREPRKTSAEGVFVELERIYRSNGQMYVRYSITNLSKSPFRTTTPEVSQPEPTQEPISILSLRDHQLSHQTFSSFKVKPGSTTTAEGPGTQDKDVSPGQKTSGVVKIRTNRGDAPQIYQLHFGYDQNHPVTAEAVL